MFANTRYATKILPTVVLTGTIVSILFTGCVEEAPTDPPAVPLVERTAPVFVAEEGLKAVISNGLDTVVRVDPEINVPYFVDSCRYRDVLGTGLFFNAPRGVQAVWSGHIRADFAETYTFHLNTADSVVLMIGATTVIDSQSDENPRTVTGSTALTVGWHEITLTLDSAAYSSSFGAVLEWSSPSVAQALVPRDNLRVVGDPADSTDPTILGLTVATVFDSWAIIRVATDEFTTAVVDYGVTPAHGYQAVHVGHATDHVITLTGLAPGTIFYGVTVTDTNGNTTMWTDFSFDTGSARSGQDVGLFAVYESLDASISRIDLTVDFPLHDRSTYDDFYAAGLDPRVEQYRTTRTGLVRADAEGLYQFTLESDDAGMLEVDGRLLTYDWERRGFRSRSNSIYLRPGWYPIRLVNVNDRYSTETAVVLKWTPPGGSEEVIPAGNLMPGAHADDAAGPGRVWMSASRVDATEATVGVETTEPSRATIEYGPTAAYGSNVSSSRIGVVHHITLSGLSADSTYHYRLVATDLAGNTTTGSDEVFQTRSTPLTAADSGLTGTYSWNGLTDVRVDQTINFPEFEGHDRGFHFYGTDMGDSAHRFVARWTGLIRIDAPEQYTFHLDTDDGAKLLIDGRVVLFQWQTGPMVTLTGSVELDAGWHSIEVVSVKAKYNDTLGTILRWSSPSIAEEVIPADHFSPSAPPGDISLPSLTAGPTRTAGTSVLIGAATDEPTRVLVEWGPGYALQVESGVVNARHTVELTPTVPGTTYDYRVTATDLAGNAASTSGQFVAEAMSSSPRNGGLLCNYTTNNGELTRIDSYINFPVHGPLDNDNYLNTALYSRGELTMYCEGLIYVDQSEEVTFSFLSEDGAILEIDGRNVFYDWTIGGQRTNEGTVFFDAGWHSLRLHMFHNWDTSIVAILKWRSPSMAEQVIPEDHFAPATFPGDISPPSIDFVGPGLVMDTSAMMRLGTNEPTLAYIEWGTTPALGNTDTNGFGDVEHAINLPNLPAGQEIYYRAAVHDMAGNWSYSVMDSFTTRTEPLSPGYGGLIGHYWSHFNPWDLERIDQNIDFPLHGLEHNNDLMGTGLPLTMDFDINWNGLIYAPASDVYTFYTTAADGISLEIDHRPVLLDWVSKGVSTAEGSIYMAEGWHIIHSRAFGDHETHFSTFQLRWSSSTIAEEVVPPENFAPWGDPRDTTPPVIVRQFLSAAQPTSITVQVEADELSRTVVEYGESLPYAFSATYDKVQVNHAVTLFNLKPSTQYHYRVVLTDLAGNVTYGPDGTFATFSESAPEIVGGTNAIYTTRDDLEVRRVDAQINFPSHAATANGFYETGLPMDRNEIATEHFGLVLVDATGYYAFQTDSDDGAILFVDDRMIINSWSDGGRRTAENTIFLSAGWHRYVLKSFNSSNTPTTGIILNIAEDGGSFAVVEQDHLIEDESPQITFLEVSNLGPSSARITLEANEPVVAILRYGQSVAYGTILENTELNTTHVFELTGLQADTVYHFAAMVRDETGNVASSGDRFFRTLANQTQLVCQTGSVYDGPTHSGQLPAVFAGDEIPICYADAGGAAIISRFRLHLVSHGLGIDDALIDTAYAPARALAWPGCLDPDWCDVDGSQNIIIDDLIPPGTYELQYIVNDSTGGSNQATYELIVANLPLAISRVVNAVEQYRADDTISEAGDRDRAILSTDVYTHALAAYDAELWGTVITSIAAMKDELMIVRGNLDPDLQSGARDEIAQLLTELNSATVHFIRDKVGSADEDGHIEQELDRAWNTRDVVASSENAANTAYWALMRDNVLRNSDAVAIEDRIAGGHQAFLNDAMALGQVLEQAAADMYAAAQADARMLGIGELGVLAAATETLALSLDDYVNLRMSNLEIATLVHDVFSLVSTLRALQDEYIGIADLEYFAALTIYAIVEVTLPNARANVCLESGHPLIEEAYRRWIYLAEELRDYQDSLDQSHMASFITAVLAPHAFWPTVGELPGNANAAFPDVPCFVAAVYNAAYTIEGDAMYYDAPVLNLPGCPETEYDYATCD